jgi:hypothetical protein
VTAKYSSFFCADVADHWGVIKGGGFKGGKARGGASIMPRASLLAAWDGSGWEFTPVHQMPQKERVFASKAHIF